jgi:hypothetical protein
MLLWILILLHDPVGLPSEFLEAAKQELALIMREAGISVRYVDCAIGKVELNRETCSPPAGKHRVRLILSPGANERRPEALGASLFHAGRAVSSTLYLRRIREVAAEASWNESDLLAHAAAHEIGHLVLGPKAHETGGVMRALWRTDRLFYTTHRDLTFLPEQASALRDALYD